MAAAAALRSVAVAAVVAACHHAPAESRWISPSPCDTTSNTPLRRGVLGAANRDSLLREAQVRRMAWRARGIKDYRVRIGMRCFCPFSPPAILEVRRGIPVALRDSTGPNAYTIEALFDLIERAGQNDELVDVSYDPCLGYPVSVRVDPKGLDNWYWVTADHLTTPR